MDIYTMNGMNGTTSRTLNGTGRVMPINGTSRVEGTINGDTSRVVPYAVSMSGIELGGDELIDLLSQGDLPDDLFNSLPDPQLDGMDDEDYLDYLEEWAAGEDVAVNGKRKERKAARRARREEKRALRDKKRQARGDRQIKGEGGLQKFVGAGTSFLTSAGEMVSAQGKALLSELEEGGGPFSEGRGGGFEKGAAAGSLAGIWAQYKIPIIVVGALAADKILGLNIVFKTKKGKK